MNIESMRDAFEVWLNEPHPLHISMTRKDYFGSSEVVLMKMAWQAATLAERERCAKMCNNEARIAVESAKFCGVQNVDLRPYAICEAAIRKGGTP